MEGQQDWANLISGGIMFQRAAAILLQGPTNWHSLADSTHSMPLLPHCIGQIETTSFWFSQFYIFGKPLKAAVLAKISPTLRLEQLQMEGLSFKEAIDLAGPEV